MDLVVGRFGCHERSVTIGKDLPVPSLLTKDGSSTVDDVTVIARLPV